jgi:putative flippase GtrA
VTVSAVAAADRAEVTADPRGHLRTIVLRFALVGATTTVLHLGLFAALQVVVASQAANSLALVLATVVNTYLNRVWTFGHRTGVGNVAREQVQGMLVFLLTWAATGGGLAALAAFSPDAATLVQVVALALCTAASTVVRFLVMRYWIFARSTPHQ